MTYRTACARVENALIDEADEALSLAGMVRLFACEKHFYRKNRMCQDLLNAITDAASEAEASALKARAEAGQTALDTVREAISVHRS